LGVHERTALCFSGVACDPPALYSDKSGRNELHELIALERGILTIKFIHFGLMLAFDLCLAFGYESLELLIELDELLGIGPTDLR
jgi:hypothetical protein